MKTSTTPYQRLARMGLRLPPPPPPIANFVHHMAAGGLLYLSGQGPVEPDGTCHAGVVGEDVTVADAYAHARLTGLNLIAMIDAATGDLCRVVRVVRLLGFVNARSDFRDHSRVMDGCSDLFGEIFGAPGAHARSAIGVSSLPRNITVEVEGVVAIGAAPSR